MVCSSALSAIKYNYKINDSYIELLVNNDGEFIVLNKTKNNILMHKKNIFSDGLYSLKNISKKGNFFVLELVFDGGGGQDQDYYYHIDEDSVSLVKESTRSLEIGNDFMRDRVCDYFYLNKANECFYLILKKAYLFDLNNRKTNMYLISGDRVRIIKDRLDTDGKWYFINYKGKKEINMWIKADAIDLN